MVVVAIVVDVANVGSHRVVVVDAVVIDASTVLHLSVTENREFRRHPILSISDSKLIETELRSTSVPTVAEVVQIRSKGLNR